MNTPGVAGQVAGFAPFDDDEIFVVYVKEDVAGALKIRFARYNFDTNTFSWNVETDCLAQCTTRISGNNNAVIQAEVRLSENKSQARVLYTDSAAIYFMTVDMSDGSTSDVYKLGDLESVNVFNWSKFLSYSVIAFEMDDLEEHSLFFYDFDSQNYNGCKTFSPYYSISEILDVSGLVQMGGLTENNYTIISKMSYYDCSYDPYHMENLDNYKIYEVSSASSDFIMTSFSESFPPISPDLSGTQQTQTDSGVSFVSTSDTSVYMRAYLDESPINLSYDIGYTGDSEELNNVCFADVFEDITYQPALTDITFVSDDDISAWGTFNSNNSTFTFTSAVEGSYSGELIFQYANKGEYARTVMIDIAASSGSSSGGGSNTGNGSISQNSNSCWNTSSKASCIILVVFVSIISFSILVALCFVIWWVTKKTTKLSNNKSKLQQVETEGVMNTEGPKQKEGQPNDPEEGTIGKVNEADDQIYI